MELLKERIQQLAQHNHNQVVAFRRYLHENPELSFQEFKTAAWIAQTLKSWGLEVQENVANTGVITVIRGKNATKKTIALRADIDALPIQEANEVPYKSKVVGVMHACGHDVHTASLMGVAFILHQLKTEFEGTVKFIFQPAEEKAPGGALAMIQAGALTHPAPIAILGQHVWPQIPVGKVGFTKGTVMASADELYIKVQGKGGHAAAPHEAIDPVLISAHLITALQQIVSRNTNPLQSSVVSICHIQGGSATNIIPEVVHLAGTLRTTNEAFRKEIHKKIICLCQSIAEGMGGKCEVNIGQGYPPTYNDPALTERMYEAAGTYLGKDQVYYMEPSMGGEDFGYYAQQIPGCFYWIGVKNVEKGFSSSLHTPTFDVDETVLTLAPGLMSWLTIQELAAV
eukprot:gene252-332_t